MLLLRAVARLAGMLVMAAVALLGLGVALYCFDGLISLGDGRPDRLLHLPRVRRHVGHWLSQLEAKGSTAGLALLCGLGAIVLGLIIITGVLRARRQRLAVMPGAGEGGVLAARPGALRALATTLAARTDGVTAVRRPKVALARTGRGGRLRLTVTRTATADAAQIEPGVQEHLRSVTEPFNLRPRIRVEAGGRGERVQ